MKNEKQTKELIIVNHLNRLQETNKFLAYSKALRKVSWIQHQEQLKQQFTQELWEALEMLYQTPIPKLEKEAA